MYKFEKKRKRNTTLLLEIKMYNKFIYDYSDLYSYIRFRNNRSRNIILNKTIFSHYLNNNRHNGNVSK